MMETVNQIMVLCGWIITIGGALKILYNAYAKARKPHDDLEERITNIENDIKEIKQNLEKDYRSINQQKDDVSILMRSMFALIENKLTGNNVDGLKKTRDDLIKALADK